MRYLGILGAFIGVAACGAGSAPVSRSLPVDLDVSAQGNLPTASALLTDDPTSSIPSAPSLDENFGTLLNAMRLDNGAGVVTHNDLLDQAAQDYAVVLLENNHFSHIGPDGSTLAERVNATGYDWRVIGENLGRGQETEQEIMDGWTGSPDHHENNINPVFEEFGLGFTRDGSDTRWVLVLGTPR